MQSWQPSGTSRMLDFGPVCPHGFVIPDDPNGYGNFYINKTMSECAAACKFAMYTDEEWDRVEVYADVSVSIGIPMMVLLIYAYVFDHDKRNHYLVRIFAWQSLANSIVTAIMQSIPLKDRFCRNNADMLRASDGFTLCALQSVVFVFTAMGMAICWLLQTNSIFMKVVLGKRNIPSKLHRDMFLIFGLPAISTIVMLITGSYGYTRGSYGCLFSPIVRENHVDMYVMFIPLSVICVAGSVMMGAVLIKTTKVFVAYYHMHRPTRSQSLGGSDETPTGLQGDGHPGAVPRPRLQAISTSAGSAPTLDGGDRSTTTVSSVGASTAATTQLQELELTSMWTLTVYLRAPILFLMIFLLIYVTLVIAGFVGTTRRNIYLGSFREWGQCALDNYNGVDDSWHAVCGAHPKVRVPAAARDFFAFCFPGQAIFFALIYGPSAVDFLWQEARFMGVLCQFLFCSKLFQSSKTTSKITPVYHVEVVNAHDPLTFVKVEPMQSVPGVLPIQAPPMSQAESFGPASELDQIYRPRKTDV